MHENIKTEHSVIYQSTRYVLTRLTKLQCGYCRCFRRKRAFFPFATHMTGSHVHSWPCLLLYVSLDTAEAWRSSMTRTANTLTAGGTVSWQRHLTPGLCSVMESAPPPQKKAPGAVLEPRQPESCLWYFIPDQFSTHPRNSANHLVCFSNTD